MNSPVRKSDAPERFTVEQANRTLPLVRAIVQDLVIQNGVVEQLTTRLERLEKVKGKKGAATDTEFTDEIEGFRRELETERSKLEAYRHELTRLGIRGRSPVGHCDFPGTIDGQEVDLCWQLDEPEILFWHPRGGAFEDRRPLVAGAGAGFDDRPEDRSWNDSHE